MTRKVKEDRDNSQQSLTCVYEKWSYSTSGCPREYN